MNLYKRMIRPIRREADLQGFNGSDVPLTKTWYNESEESRLREKYEPKCQGFFWLEFEEKYVKVKAQGGRK